jgi:hypothetical protein
MERDETARYYIENATLEPTLALSIDCAEPRYIKSIIN